MEISSVISGKNFNVHICSLNVVHLYPSACLIIRFPKSFLYVNIRINLNIQSEIFSQRTILTKSTHFRQYFWDLFQNKSSLSVEIYGVLGLSKWKRTHQWYSITFLKKKLTKFDVSPARRLYTSLEIEAAT